MLQSCNARLSSYFKAQPDLFIDSGDNPRVKMIRARARHEQMRLQQTSLDASGLLLTRPNSFVPAVDIVQARNAQPKPSVNPNPSPRTATTRS